MRWMLLPVAALSIAAAPIDAAKTAILAAMTNSAAGWNAGDLDRFMAVYADDAVYVTPRELVRGKAAIAERYRLSFAKGGNSRGTLTFTDTAFRAVDPSHEMLWAAWHLRPADPAAKTANGWTTLLFERRAEAWKIVSDHSS